MTLNSDPVDRLTQSGDTMDRLAERTDLLDVGDPAFRDVLYNVAVQAAMRGIDVTVARTFVSIGYIAGRLRGRKEAHMATILGEESDG